MVTIPELNFTGQQLKDTLDALAGAGGGAGYAPAAYFPPANNYIANMLPGGYASSITLGTGYIYLSGIRFDRNITVADAGLHFRGTGANARVVVYKQRADDETIADLVFEGAELAAAKTYVASTCNLTFEAGALYLIGCTMDASIELSSVPRASAAFAFGIGSGTSLASEIVTLVAHTYANAAPATVPIPGSTSNHSSAPLVKFKVVSSTAG